MNLPIKHLSIVSIGLASSLALPAHAVVIDNGIASGTLGSWSVDVTGGGQTRTGNLTALRADTNTLTNSEVVFDYYSYLKIGSTGQQLSESATVTSVGTNSVKSAGTFTGSNGNAIQWSVTSTIAANSPVMVNVFDFSASQGTLGLLGLFQYLDEDVVGAGNDVFFTRGSAATNDLQLYTIDNAQGFGVSHGGAYSSTQGLQNSSFLGWAVDNYNDMKPRLSAGTQNVSLAGIVEAGLTPDTNPYVGSVLGPIDIVSVLGWSVDPNATTARIITTLGGLPDVRNIDDNNVPEPDSIALIGLGFAGLAAVRRRKA